MIKRHCAFVAALALASLAAGCTTLDIAKGRIEDRVQDLASEYCSLAQPTRLIVRGAANHALAGNAAIVVVCDGDPEFSEFHAAHVAPYDSPNIAGALIDAMLATGKREIELPDGTTVRLEVSRE